MAKVEDLIRPDIRALQAYHVPHSTGLIKLDAMENPYGWPEDVKPAWLEALRAVALNRYPDPGAAALKQRLRSGLQVPDGAALLLGNGSDELIQMILLALARPGSAAMAPVPTFVMYELLAAVAGMRFIGVPLKDDFSLDLSAMRAAAARHRPAVIFLAYPNNPTGNLFSASDVEQIIESAPGLVVLDEAYYAFAQSSFIDRLARYDHLLVMRTLSKQGLAGLRLGVLVGAPVWLAELDKVRLPYNIGSLTQASAAFALDHASTFDEQARRIRADRDALFQALARMPEIEAWPSRANFILFRVRTRPATEVYRALHGAGVLVKNLDSAGGPLAGCLRVTVGTAAENRAFLDALAAALHPRA